LAYIFYKTMLKL